MVAPVRNQVVQSREWNTTEDQNFRDNVDSIRVSLEEIAGIANYIKKITPYLIAAIGVGYPAVAKFIQALNIPTIGS